MAGKLEMQVLNADVLNRALRTVPLEARKEVAREMSGRRGLGVEWKRAIAKTFKGRGNSRLGEKWLYTDRTKSPRQPLSHNIGGETLDTLYLKIYAWDSAAIHELGGRVTPEHHEYLAIPLENERSYRDRRRRLRVREIPPQTRVVRKLPDGRILIGERRATSRQAERGDESVKWYFIFQREATHKGGRLRFRDTTAKMRPKAIKRFDRALRRVVRNFDAAA